MCDLVSSSLVEAMVARADASEANSKFSQAWWCMVNADSALL